MPSLRPFIPAAAACLLAACAQPGPPPQPVFGNQPQAPVFQTPVFPTTPVYAKPQPTTPVYAKPQPTTPAYPAHPAPAQTAPGVAAAWRLIGQPVSEALAGRGATRMAARATNGAAAVDLHLVVFDSRQCGIRVIDQPQPGAGGGVIAAAMRANRAVAGVNGGFFTPEFQPLGLMISGGRRSGSMKETKLLSGMFLSAGGLPYLIWRGEFEGDRGVIDLVQAGPRLVDGGAPVSGLERNAPRVRTFIAADGHHGWVIGVARSASLGALADLLATPGIIPGLRVMRALNLDGGNSSAIWMHTARGQEISEPGWSTVRNFIAIVPR